MISEVLADGSKCVRTREIANDRNQKIFLLEILNGSKAIFRSQKAAVIPFSVRLQHQVREGGHDTSYGAGAADGDRPVVRQISRADTERPNDSLQAHFIFTA